METSPDKTRRSGGHARSGPLLRARDAEAPPPRHRAPAATSREGTRARSSGVRPALLAAGAAGAAVVLIGGATLALGGDDAPAAPSTAAPRASATSAPATPSAAPPAPADAQLSAAVTAATAADRTPADLRAALQEQLTARANANLALLRSAWAGDEAAATVAEQALATSSEGLAAVVSAWRDPDLASRIRAGLDDQSEASRAYAAAVGRGDTAAADEGRTRMGEVSRELGGLLDGVTDGGIATYVPPQDAARYRAFVDALEAEDAEAADEQAQWLRSRLAREGLALAAGLEGGPS